MRRPWLVIASLVLQLGTLVCSVIGFLIDARIAGFVSGVGIAFIGSVLLFWIFIGIMIWQGRNWARVLLTISLVFQLGGAIVDAVSQKFAYNSVDYLGCLLSVVAVIVLWLPPSRLFFRKAVAKPYSFE